MNCKDDYNMQFQLHAIYSETQLNFHILELDDFLDFFYFFSFFFGVSTISSTSFESSISANLLFNIGVLGDADIDNSAILLTRLSM